MIGALLLAVALQDRNELLEQLRQLQQASVGATFKREPFNAAVGAAVKALLDNRVGQAAEQLAIARGVATGETVKARLLPGLRLMTDGAAATIGVKVIAVADATGDVTLRVRNRRDEVVVKQEVALGKTATLDLSELSEGTYVLEGGGARTLVHIVHDLNLRLKKIAADLPGERGAPEVASLSWRLSLLDDAMAGRAVELPDDTIAELKQLEADVETLLDGKEPSTTRKGTWLRAVMIEKRRLPYVLHVPASNDRKKEAPLVVALADRGWNETFWTRATPLLELAEAKGCLVVAPRVAGDVAEILKQVRAEHGVGATWLLGHGEGADGCFELKGEILAFAPTRAAGRRVQFLACGKADAAIERSREIAKSAATYDERAELDRFSIVWTALKAAIERVN